MNIHEYQAKEIFTSFGLPVPGGNVATTVDEAVSLAKAQGLPVMVKCQVLTGGRGKAGGIRIAGSPEEAEAAATKILGMKIKHTTVHKVLVEPASTIAKEAYLSLIVDRANRSISFIASAEGGVEIEEVAAKTPEKILRAHSTSGAFPEEEARGIAGQLFGDPSLADPVLDTMRKLFKLFVEKDCSLAEINPLVLTVEGQVVALDGKITFDDNGLFRQADILELRDMAEENVHEIEAKEQGLSYVELDGDIGCMVNGAGLAMATMDMIKLYGGEPANFLDVGGSSNPEKVVNAFKLILRKGNVKAVMINIFGGITRCDDIAEGILEAFKRIDIHVPVVVRLSGTNAKEGRKLLEGASLISAETFSDAVQKVVDISKEVTS